MKYAFNLLVFPMLQDHISEAIEPSVQTQVKLELFGRTQVQRPRPISVYEVRYLLRNQMVNEDE